MKPLTILSVCDGLSGARLALDFLHIPINYYFASEIDKFCISVSTHRYTDIFHLGDIRDIKSYDLPPIDLLIGGTPCQGFSQVGSRLNFEHPQSKLFFDFVELLEIFQPTYFFLENVRMKPEWRDIISQHLFCEPILLNSANFGPQHRERLYWFNWESPPAPQVNREFISHVLSDEPVWVSDYYPDVEYHPTPGKTIAGLLKLPGATQQQSRVYHPYSKSPTIIAQGRAAGRLKVINSEGRIRFLSPLETERLQGLPDNWTKYGIGATIISDSQRYKMIGNAFNIPTVAHILRGLPL